MTPHPDSPVLDLQPQLRGELVALRPLLPADFDALFACASDPLIWEQHPESTRYRRDVFEGFFQRALESKGALAAIDLATQQILGTSRFYWLATCEREKLLGNSPGNLLGTQLALDPTRPQLSIGYTFLERKYWQRGYNREMKRLMLEHAFKSVEQVLFQIGAGNRRSRTAVEKLGAKLIAERDLDGKAHVVYRLTRN